jgi:hypothetical protein
MIFPEVNFEQWAAKYHLDVKYYTCPLCKKNFQTNVPFLTRDSAGLQSPIHDCGDEFWIAVMRPRTADAEQFWSSIV